MVLGLGFRVGLGFLVRIQGLGFPTGRRVSGLRFGSVRGWIQGSVLDSVLDLHRGGLQVQSRLILVRSNRWERVGFGLQIGS